MTERPVIHQFCTLLPLKNSIKITRITPPCLINSQATRSSPTNWGRSSHITWGGQAPPRTTLLKSHILYKMTGRICRNKNKNHVPILVWSSRIPQPNLHLDQVKMTHFSIIPSSPWLNPNPFPVIKNAHVTTTNANTWNNSFSTLKAEQTN